MDHNEHTEPRVYELGYHLVPTLAVEQIPQASGAVRGMIEQISKDIIAEEIPVFIDLAYTIVKTVEHKNKNFDQAYFGWIKFETNPENIATLEDALKKDENVLRYLVVKTIKEDTFIAKKFTGAKVKEEEIEESKENKETEEDSKKDESIDKAIEELVA